MREPQAVDNTRWKWCESVLAARCDPLTATPPLIPPRTGRSSSSGRPSRERNRTGSSSTTATTFTPASSIRPEVDGLEHLENAVPRAPGERFLRTPRRKYPPRVFGFPDSAERETPAENSQGVGGSLQPGPATLQPGARYSRTVGRHSGTPNFRSLY